MDLNDNSTTLFLKKVREWDKNRCIDFIVKSKVFCSTINSLKDYEINEVEILNEFDLSKLKSIIITHVQSLNIPNQV